MPCLKSTILIASLLLIQRPLVGQASFLPKRSNLAAEKCRLLLRARIEGHHCSFKVFRDLYDYFGYFRKTTFKQDLQLLGDDQVWIDMGSGDSNALIEFAHLHPPRQTNPYLIGYTYRGLKHSNSIQKLNQRLGPDRVRIIQGFFFEDLTNEQFLQEFPRADLITDVHGVFSYTDDPVLVLSRYLEKLNHGGKIHVFLDYSRNQGLLEWLKKSRGFDLLLPDGSEPSYIALTLIRNSDAIYLPEIKVKFVDGSPPDRTFKMVKP